MPMYLADSSIWIGARRHEYLAQLLGRRIAGDEIVTCVPVVIEVLCGPPTAAAFEADWANVWSQVRWIGLTEEASERALAVQRGLAATTDGAHRRRPMDYLVAACAEAEPDEIVVWHWDNDLRVICDFTGQPQEAEHERAKAEGSGGLDES